MAASILTCSITAHSESSSIAGLSADSVLHSSTFNPNINHFWFPAVSFNSIDCCGLEIIYESLYKSFINILLWLINRCTRRISIVTTSQCRWTRTLCSPTTTPSSPSTRKTSHTEIMTISPTATIRATWNQMLVTLIPTYILTAACLHTMSSGRRMTKPQDTTLTCPMRMVWTTCTVTLRCAMTQAMTPVDLAMANPALDRSDMMNLPLRAHSMTRKHSLVLKPPPRSPEPPKTTVLRPIPEAFLYATTTEGLHELWGLCDPS